MAGISIALATHNGEKYLAHQLQSLALQTKLPAELVVSDDCSTDRTVEIVQEFASRAPFPVRFHRGERQIGFIDNFMRAAHHCQSELIAFCDQDDIWEADKLAVMEQPFDDPEVQLAYHNATLIDAHDNAIGHLYRGRYGQRHFAPLTRHPWLVIPGFTQLFRRRLIEFSALHASSRDLHWPDKPLTHDRWFVLLASVLGSIVFVRQPLVRYRQHGTNAFGVYRDSRARYDHLIGAERFVREAAAAAKNRSEILVRVADIAKGTESERARQGVEFYRALADRLDRRIAIYDSGAYRQRIKALVGLLGEGGYSSKRGAAHFTVADLLFDFYLAAPLGPRLRRLLRQLEHQEN